MKKLPYIRPSFNFHGKYEVVIDSDTIIPCYNLATAVTIKKDAINDRKRYRN
jgi:hypothetical protein